MILYACEKCRTHVFPEPPDGAPALNRPEAHWGHSVIAVEGDDADELIGAVYTHFATRERIMALRENEVVVGQ